MIVISVGTVREAVSAVIAAFEREGGQKITINYRNTTTMLGEIKGGASADLVIGYAETIDDLVQTGKIVRGRIDILRSSIGLAVRAGARKPDIGSADALKAALLAAKSVAYSKGPSGTHFASVIQCLGIAGQISSKTVAVQGGPVGAAVAKGEAEIGVQQIAELLPVAGIDLVGPLPGDLQKTIVFSAGISANAADSEAARAFVHFFSSAAAASVIGQKGMEPA